MPVPADPESADNVIRLNFAARPVPALPPPVPPLMLEVRADGWKLHTGGRALDADDLTAAADMLRDIARSLAAMARDAAGQPAQSCIAEFVLYETGGIDHWVAEGADRSRLRLGLRTAIGTIRES